MPTCRRVLFVAALTTALTACLPGSFAHAQAATRKKQVLVLNTARNDERFSVVAAREVPRRLAEDLPGGADYYTEYLDALRFPQPQYENVYVDFLRTKYGSKRFDLVMLMGDVAIEFMTRNRNAIFAGTPVVFYSLNPPRGRMPNSTGLINQFDFKGSVDLARALQPDLQHLYVVSGSSASDRAFEERARVEFGVFEGPIEVTYLSGLRAKDLEQRLRTLPPRSAVYYVLVSQDSAGEHFQQIAYMTHLASVANAPTYSWADSGAESGTVGGSRRDQVAETRAIATLGLRVLHGERADTIPISRLHTDVVQVDWRQLRRWKISESRVPRGAVVLFREPGIWGRYKHYIIASLAVLLAQTALIAVLLVQKVMLRRAGEQVRTSQDELRTSYERIRDLGRRLIGAQEAERGRIARELHDDIGQQVAMLSIELDSVRLDQRADKRKRLSQVLERAYGIATSIHEMSHQLHPTKLQLVGLVAAVESLKHDFSRPHLSIAFSHSNMPAAIAHDVGLCLYRVVQEGLRNALRHSGASHVWVDLHADEAELALTITDDGKGFDVDDARGDGLGLVSMRERLESVGGVLGIHSALGSGTRLSVTVPICVIPAPTFGAPFEAAVAGMPGGTPQPSST